MGICFFDMWLTILRGESGRFLDGDLDLWSLTFDLETGPLRGADYSVVVGLERTDCSLVRADCSCLGSLNVERLDDAMRLWQRNFAATSAIQAAVQYTRQSKH